MEPIENSIPLARLIVVRAGMPTDETFVFASPAVIGRFDPSVGPIDIDLGSTPEGAYVSRKHAKITCEDNVWSIEDLGSSNGTYVKSADFEKVEKATIEDGTEIALGNARFVFRLGTGDSESDAAGAAPADDAEVPEAVVDLGDVPTPDPIS